jgi:hypothetical protein
VGRAVVLEAPSSSGLRRTLAAFIRLTAVDPELRGNILSRVAPESTYLRTNVIRWLLRGERIARWNARQADRMPCRKRG